MTTASSMIYSALIMNGEKTIGGSLTSGEATYYLDRMNAMLESWSIDRLMCYQVVQESFSLTSGTASYTIGSGGVFNTARPTKIVDPCFIRDASNFDTPVGLIGAESYGQFVDKSTSGSVPSYLFYDSAYVAGLATIYLYPAPMANLTLYINSWQQLQNFSTISVSTVLPPGYQIAIESNFGVQAGIGFKPASDDLKRLARDTKAAIKTVNTPDAMMRLDYGIAGAVRAGQSILTGP